MSKKELPSWDRVRQELGAKFEEAGILQCELQLPYCTFGLWVQFAHAKKRRHWETKEDVYDVIRVCQVCHGYIEALGNKKIITMAEVVHGTQNIRSVEI